MYATALKRPTTTVGVHNENDLLASKRARCHTTILPIDSCETTFGLESQFITEYLPEQYVYNMDNTSTVILSRALNTSYIWPKDKPLTIDALSQFAENGHTLGIDYRYTYCRMFALDLDCSCRKTGSTIEHLNENIVALVVEKLQELFNQTFKIPNAVFSIWRNKCGFHIYTDIPVSQPTHLFLKKQLESNAAFLNQPIVFEVPSIMPLPYSAKTQNCPYTPVNTNHDLDFTPLTIHQDGKCLELFVFQRIALDGRTAAKINSIIGDEYLVKLSRYQIRRSNPRLVNVSSITLYDNFEYMTQFQEYVMLMVSQYNASITTIQDVDFSEFTEDERLQIRLFMSFINKLFGVPGDESCDVFTRISAMDYGGLYLQPFVAALFLNLQFSDQFTDFARFKMLLRKIYASPMKQYASIERFIDLVNIQTFQAYSDEGCEGIINHLHFMISHNTKPTQTLNEKINSIMEKMTDTTADVVLAAIQKENTDKDKSKAEVIIMDIMEKFNVIFFELKILFYDQSSSRYYYLNPVNGASYESSAKLTDELYPSVIRAWIGYSITATNVLKNKLERSHDMHICDPIGFTQTEYMYSTKVGVFNSAVGLYTAQTRFLRFNKFRQISIWPYGETEKAFYAQNESILHHYRIVEQIVDNIHQKLFELYTHSVFAPAIIQLRNLMMIEERFIEQIFRLLANHHKSENFDYAAFLMDYYQFDPRLVYLAIHLCNDYGGLEIFYSYTTLCSKIFQTEHVTSIVWSEKFQSVMLDARYDMTKPTYRERLETLSGEHITNVNSTTMLCVVVVLACITKCESFVEFTRAFNITMPEKITEHPAYHDFEPTTNITTMKRNITRARSIVFGENLTPFQHTLIDELFSICMSADFKPETVVNYLTAVGSMFIPINVLKKLLLIHGDQDVGKSLSCKKITAIAQPSSCRFDDISAVMARSSVAEYSAVILNEAKTLNASQLKIVTGNDDTSSMKFYSQKYELQQMQTHMFGATNVHVSFKGREDVDKTSVSRLYAIMFTGINVPAESAHSSLLAMMTGGCYFSGLLSPIFAKSIDALRWLSFGIYMNVRDINYFPKLDLSCDTCRDYQHTVYYNNSSLYKFLVDSGIVDAPGFTITKNRLFDIVRQNLDKTGRFSSLSIFRLAFEKQYNISFDKITHIKNFQQVGLIQHIIDNMMVIDDPNAVITHDDIKARLNKYTLMEHRDNALSYFQRTQEKNYDYNRRVYVNISFSSDLGDSYEGNEMLLSSSAATSLSLGGYIGGCGGGGSSGIGGIDRDSLVMKSI